MIDQPIFGIAERETAKAAGKPQKKLGRIWNYAQKLFQSLRAVRGSLYQSKVRLRPSRKAKPPLRALGLSRKGLATSLLHSERQFQTYI